VKHPALTYAGTLAIYGFLYWVVSERSFDYARSITTHVIALGIVLAAIVAFSLFAGFVGGTFRRVASGDSAD